MSLNLLINFKNTILKRDYELRMLIKRSLNNYCYIIKHRVKFEKLKDF